MRVTCLFCFKLYTKNGKHSHDQSFSCKNCRVIILPEWFIPKRALSLHRNTMFGDYGLSKNKKYIIPLDTYAYTPALPKMLYNFHGGQWEISLL